MGIAGIHVVAGSQGILRLVVEDIHVAAGIRVAAGIHEILHRVVGDKILEVDVVRQLQADGVRGLFGAAAALVVHRHLDINRG